MVEKHLNVLQCAIPDADAQREINTWNPLQSVHTARLSRSISSDASGVRGIGFRDTAQDMLARLETMALTAGELPLEAIRAQIAAGIDIIIHLGRLRDHSRKLLEIVEVVGYVNHEIVLSPLYTFVEEGCTKEGKIQGSFIKKEALIHKEKCISAGIEGI